MRFFSKTAYRWKYMFVRMNESKALDDLQKSRDKLFDLVHTLD
jgi:hypothetical protein